MSSQHSHNRIVLSTVDFYFVDKPEDRAYICSVWGIDEQDLPHAGYPATLMIPAMLRQEIRACFMICSNPMVSLPISTPSSER